MNRREKHHCEKYDAYFNPKTGEWLEPKCGSDECEYCSKRPPKHMPHTYVLPSGEEVVCE